MLYIVSTPIGNLKDITLRAIETLKSVDLIAAEDTRHTRILLQAYDIFTPMTSFFEQNEKAKTEGLIEQLRQGKNIALVSDAGTPGISDPGYRLIRAASEQGIPLTVIPGPCALIAGLCLSGLPTDKFIFEGFLPVKSAARRKRLAALAGETRTVIFYESPHRIVAALQDIGDTLNDPQVVVARELTKKFEAVKKDQASKLAAHFSQIPPKGEFMLLLNLSPNVYLPEISDDNSDYLPSVQPGWDKHPGRGNWNNK
ncbi:MAG: 16S rRNA (cytidine(1402)-2'-O)-methyltransferase [Candidatus Omnitrophica bacterium]|nr:16S rRNA (cytidine(1402)-2'-O)-methyltransferase [Candidatus Omnitrophota bacterium]